MSFFEHRHLVWRRRLIDAMYFSRDFTHNRMIPCLCVLRPSLCLPVCPSVCMSLSPHLVSSVRTILFLFWFRGKWSNSVSIHKDMEYTLSTENPLERSGCLYHLKNIYKHNKSYLMQYLDLLVNCCVGFDLWCL